MQSILILGRQPALGLAELESLYGSTVVTPVTRHAALLDLDPSQVDFARLGGSSKLAEVLDSVDTAKWDALEKYLTRKLPDYLADFPEGKITLGLSSYGLVASPARIGATALSVKKAVRKRERSVRIVPNQDVSLNSAQVIHNHLTSPNGCEIVLIENGGSTLIARTMAEQNIASYTIRDRERPKRDAKVGMLPPKLAQIIINLTNPTPGSTILDPFCGTGVLLQEAMLMGFNVEGSDLERRMIEYTRTNLEWLRDTLGVHEPTALLNPGDATTTVWAHDASFVATETYLGRPFTEKPSTEMIARTSTEVNLILKKFLKNIHGQLIPGARLCLAIPAWALQPKMVNGQWSMVNGFRHLPLIDQISDLGYNRVSFEHVRSEQLLYYREDQFTARELLVLTKQ